MQPQPSAVFWQICSMKRVCAELFIPGVRKTRPRSTFRVREQRGLLRRGQSVLAGVDLSCEWA